MSLADKDKMHNMFKTELQTAYRPSYVPQKLDKFYSPVDTKLYRIGEYKPPRMVYGLPISGVPRKKGKDYNLWKKLNPNETGYISKPYLPRSVPYPFITTIALPGSNEALVDRFTKSLTDKLALKSHPSVPLDERTLAKNRTTASDGYSDPPVQRSTRRQQNDVAMAIRNRPFKKPRIDDDYELSTKDNNLIIKSYEENESSSYISNVFEGVLSVFENAALKILFWPGVTAAFWKLFSMASNHYMRNFIRGGVQNMRRLHPETELAQRNIGFGDRTLINQISTEQLHQAANLISSTIADRSYTYSPYRPSAPPYPDTGTETEIETETETETGTDTKQTETKDEPDVTETVTGEPDIQDDPDVKEELDPGDKDTSISEHVLVLDSLSSTQDSVEPGGPSESSAEPGERQVSSAQNVSEELGKVIGAVTVLQNVIDTTAPLNVRNTSAQALIDVKESLRDTSQETVFALRNLQSELLQASMYERQQSSIEDISPITASRRSSLGFADRSLDTSLQRRSSVDVSFTARPDRKSSLIDSIPETLPTVTVQNESIRRISEYVQSSPQSLHERVSPRKRSRQPTPVQQRQQQLIFPVPIISSRHVPLSDPLLYSTRSNRVPPLTADMEVTLASLQEEIAYANAMAYDEYKRFLSGPGMSSNIPYTRYMSSLSGQVAGVLVVMSDTLPLITAAIEENPDIQPHIISNFVKIIRETSKWSVVARNPKRNKLKKIPGLDPYEYLASLALARSQKASKPGKKGKKAKKGSR